MLRVRKILCPVDFFPASVRAAEFAIVLAQNYDAKLHFLHINPPVLPGTYEYAIAMSGGVRPTDKSSAQEMRRLVNRAREFGCVAEGDLLLGDVYDEIKRAIPVFEPDLVVMGTHGRRGVERWFMGSTTEKLLRHSPVPILTISAAEERPLTTPRFARILVTTDFSTGSNDALAYAFSLAQESESQITLLHVAEVVDGVAVDLSDSYSDPSVKGIQRQLENLIPVEVRNWCDIVTRVEAGTPYRVILEILEAENIDLLVMNIHGKGMLDRALLGSTAERVVRGARSPVILIPPMKSATSRSDSQVSSAA